MKPNTFTITCNKCGSENCLIEYDTMVEYDWDEEVSDVTVDWYLTCLECKSTELLGSE